LSYLDQLECDLGAIGNPLGLENDRELSLPYLGLKILFEFTYGFYYSIVADHLVLELTLLSHDLGPRLLQYCLAVASQ
jgi:hypothetical protein